MTLDAERRSGLTVGLVDPSQLVTAMEIAGLDVTPLDEGSPFRTRAGDTAIMRRKHMAMWFVLRATYFLEGVRPPDRVSYNVADKAGMADTAGIDGTVGVDSTTGVTHGAGKVDTADTVVAADVIIVGAGPIGLKLAAALRLRGIQKVQILEQGSSVAPVVRKWYDGAIMHSLPYLITVAGIPTLHHGRCDAGNTPGWGKCSGAAY